MYTRSNTLFWMGTLLSSINKFVHLKIKEMIKVNEIFGPTFQGEGKSCGMPVAFLRLATCNLHCFKCDTPFTWLYEGSKMPHVDGVYFKKSNEIHPMDVDQILALLTTTGMQHLVVSGGEPFLQQKELIPLFINLKKLGWFIEVETNGTLIPTVEFLGVIDQINCSPKLEGEFSGESKKVRIKEPALTALSKIEKVNFKFVICEPGNIEEVLQLVDQFKMQEVRLMPECRTNEEMVAKEPMVRKLCEQYNFIYCTRLSIEISGTKRGV